MTDLNPQPLEQKDFSEEGFKGFGRGNCSSAGLFLSPLPSEFSGINSTASNRETKSPAWTNPLGFFDSHPPFSSPGNLPLGGPHLDNMSHPPSRHILLDVRQGRFGKCRYRHLDSFADRGRSGADVLSEPRRSRSKHRFDYNPFNLCQHLVTLLVMGLYSLFLAYVDHSNPLFIGAVSTLTLFSGLIILSGSGPVFFE